MSSLFQEGIKIQLQRKVDRRICERDITFLTVQPPFYVIFCCFFLSNSFPFPSDVQQVRQVRLAPIKIHNIHMGGILCDDIMSKRWKI